MSVCFCSACFGWLCSPVFLLAPRVKDYGCFAEAEAEEGQPDHKGISAVCVLLHRATCDLTKLHLLTKLRHQVFMESRYEEPPMYIPQFPQGWIVVA